MIINQIGGGTTPTGTTNITANGTHNVAGYEFADVNVPTTAPAHYIEKMDDGTGKLVQGTTIIDLTGITDIGSNALYSAYRNNSNIPANTNIDMSSITTISGNNACQNMFQSCTGITSVDLSSLTTISGQHACDSMFINCSSLRTVDLSSLTTINTDYACQNMFNGYMLLNSIDLSSLTTINGNYACDGMFYGHQMLASADLSSLTTVSGQYACRNMFINCNSLNSIDFNSLTTINSNTSYPVFASMFNGCTGLKSVKFNALKIIPARITGTSSQLFKGCKALESVEFGALVASTFSNVQDQLQYLFDSNTGSTAPNGCTVHFPSNFDPSDPAHSFDASTLAGYPTFGGSASYIHVAFDLPASE